jgi:alpha-tubulin suppressor-like RCC1 family protein
VNFKGELADGTTMDRGTPAPALVSPGVAMARVLELGTGVRHGCAIPLDQGLICWGDNDWAQLGTGDRASSVYPVQMLSAPMTPLANMVDLGVGALFTCALDAGGALWCTGSLRGTPLDHGWYAGRIAGPL